VTRHAFVRLPVYIWAAPSTLVGLLFALLALHRGRLAIVDGVLEAQGPLLARVLGAVRLVPSGIAAITLGHVVLGRDAATLEWTRAHERVHVRQSERWGPLFVPAYLVASAWAVMQGGHAYYDNVFEREARRSG
jgi:hypothetical protein